MGGGGGGGWSNPVKKVVKNVVSEAKEFKKTAGNKVKYAVGAAINPVGTATSFGSKALGVKTDAVFNPIGTVAGEATEMVYDKPMAEKKAAAERAKADEEAQGRFIAGMESRAKQEKAEKTAAEDLEKAKARQRKKADKGRRSTILTDSLGGVGGEEGQAKKSLLGL